MTSKALGNVATDARIHEVPSQPHLGPSAVVTRPPVLGRDVGVILGAAGRLPTKLQPSVDCFGSGGGGGVSMVTSLSGQSWVRGRSEARQEGGGRGVGHRTRLGRVARVGHVAAVHRSRSRRQPRAGSVHRVYLLLQLVSAYNQHLIRLREFLFRSSNSGRDYHDDYLIRKLFLPLVWTTFFK